MIRVLRLAQDDHLVWQRGLLLDEVNLKLSKLRLSSDARFAEALRPEHTGLKCKHAFAAVRAHASHQVMTVHSSPLYGLHYCQHAMQMQRHALQVREVLSGRRSQRVVDSDVLADAAVLEAHKRMSSSREAAAGVGSSGNAGGLAPGQRAIEGDCPICYDELHSSAAQQVRMSV